MILDAFILQCTVLSRIEFLGCSPNLLLILAFIAGYSRGKIPGLLMGFFAGLCLDVFYCDILGFNALLLMIIGYVSGGLNKYFYSDNIYVPITLLVCSDLFYCLIYYVFWFATRMRFEIGYYLLHVILPEFFLTLIAGVILYLPLAKLNNRLSVDA